MKIFLRSVAFFGIGLIALNLLIYFLLSRPILYDKYIVSADSMDEYRNFLLADSHGAAVGKKYLAKYGIYNFSFGSDNYCDMYNKLTFVIQQNIPIDTVLITADDHTLSPYREAINNLNRSIQYANAESYSHYSHRNTLLFYSEKYVMPYLPLFNTSNSRLFSYYLLSTILPKSEMEGDTSRKKSSTAPKAITAEVRERVAYQFPGGDSSKLLSSCLKGIIDLCQENGIVFIGIKFPLSDGYAKLLGQRSYHGDQILIQSGAAIIDLKMVFTQDDSLFKDPDHITDEGAKIFSSLLYQELKKHDYNSFKR